MQQRRRRLRGTWTRAGEWDDEVIRVYSGPDGWDVEHTGEPARRGLTETAALLAVRRITGDAWRYTPPPCDCQIQRQRQASVLR